VVKRYLLSKEKIGTPLIVQYVMHVEKRDVAQQCRVSNIRMGTIVKAIFAI
jgi:hypothetical protein